MSPLAIFGIGLAAIIGGTLIFLFLVLGPVSMAGYWSEQKRKHWMERGE